ncbi:MAG: hypothetical protein A2Y62_07665 [Candidatus Fischerbacteria bacterium RBG_13_37_8]|uniref:HPt domain-containing protein n=1 Tax=Candidatus Fischerbacteria bacterium RBG_13_37_8 TaxID=1817863 RepID=A0A1F5V954_9BACT|nr:MAG: hypothetical protein A2Y62_07665 [Candidatus Fischerbacteria bacterium RBG_13_37_8]
MIDELSNMLDDNEIYAMKKIFFEQAYERITELKNLLLQLKDGIDNETILHTMMRHFHTLGGDSAVINLTYVSTLARKAEELLTKVINKQISVNLATIELLDYCIDTVDSLLHTSEKNTSDLANWAKIYKKNESCT